jgi:transcription factor SFP1
MTGTSPYLTQQSPSFHSNSYIPKLEANFMRDFTCCSRTWPTLHDLIQHFEESHHTGIDGISNGANNGFGSVAGMPRPNGSRSNTASSAAERAQSATQALQGFQQARQNSNSGTGGVQPVTPGAQRQNVLSQMNDDVDAVGEMELDEAVGPIEMDDNQRTMQQTRQLFGQQQRPPLHLNSTGLNHQALRTSQPTTPAAASFGFQNNPTVSSVNTPTLTTQQGLPQRNQHFSQDRTGPDLVEEMLGAPSGSGISLAQFPRPTIDDPGRRLYSPGGPAQMTNQQRQIEQQLQLQQKLQMLNMDLSQLPPGTDANLLLQQLSAMMIPNEEHKPFRCPVVGCEKAYKNQNGLK